MRETLETPWLPRRPCFKLFMHGHKLSRPWQFGWRRALGAAYLRTVPTKTAKPKAMPNVEARVIEARTHLTEHDFAKVATFAPKSVRDAVIAALTAQGFEQTKSSVSRSSRSFKVRWSTGQ